MLCVVWGEEDLKRKKSGKQFAKKIYTRNIPGGNAPLKKKWECETPKKCCFVCICT